MNPAKMSAKEFDEWATRLYGPEPPPGDPVEWGSSSERDAFIDAHAGMSTEAYAMCLDDSHPHWEGKGSPYWDVALRDETIGRDICRARRQRRRG